MSRQAGIEELELSEEEADKTAVGSMGNGTLMAEDLIRRESGQETRSPWKLTIISGTFLVLAHLTPWLMFVMPYRVLGIFDPLFFDKLVEAFVLLVFGLACYRARKWLIGPMAAWVLGAFLVTWLFGWMVAVAPRNADKAKALAQLDRSMPKYERAMAGDLRDFKVPNGFNAPKVGEVDSRMIVPFLPVPLASASQQGIWEQFVPTAGEAGALWAKNGPAYVKNLRTDITGSEASGTFLATLARAVPMVAGTFSYEISVIGITNALALMLVNRRRRRKSNLRVA